MRRKVVLSQFGQLILCHLSRTGWVWEYGQGITGWKMGMVWEGAGDGAGAVQAWVLLIFLIVYCKGNHFKGGVVRSFSLVDEDFPVLQGSFCALELSGLCDC